MQAQADQRGFPGRPTSVRRLSIKQSSKIGRLCHVQDMLQRNAPGGPVGRPPVVNRVSTNNQCKEYSRQNEGSTALHRSLRLCSSACRRASHVRVPVCYLLGVMFSK
jgi:hypothetical protein